MRNITNMKKIILGILILTLNSCHLIGKGNGIKFKIENNSELIITNVKFYTSEKLAIAEFDKIEPNENISDFLTMKNNKSDGEYILEFTRENGIKEKSNGGYYTNGGALDRWIEFDVKSDTTFVKLSRMKY